MKHSWCAAAGFVLVVLLLVIVPPAHASDDSNSENLATTTALSPQATAAALNALSQNLNDTNIKQELSQFNSQTAAGNYSSAASTLVQLRTDAANSPDASGAFNALLKSLSVGPNGLSINSNLLSSLLGVNNPAGGGPASDLGTKNPQQVSVDLDTLANLLQGVNPTLATDLFEASQSALGTSGVGLPSFQQLGISSGIIHPLSISPPSIGGGPGVSDPGVVILPILLVGGIIVVFLSRRRIVSGLGAQALPGGQVLEDDGSYAGLNLQDPRQRIIMLFGRAVRTMRDRGVPKLRSETHREFSSRLGGRWDGQHVSRIATLYEKARFSTLKVTPADAEDAQREVDILERGFS